VSALALTTGCVAQVDGETEPRYAVSQFANLETALNRSAEEPFRSRLSEWDVVITLDVAAAGPSAGILTSIWLWRAFRQFAHRHKARTGPFIYA